MLTEFFMERAQIVLSADAERFIGTVPEFPELRVEAPTPEDCQRRLREEMSRLLMLDALASPPHPVSACRSCGARGFPTTFQFCGICGQKL
jgi:hypothetical protein